MHTTHEAINGAVISVELFQGADARNRFVTMDILNSTGISNISVETAVEIADALYAAAGRTPVPVEADTQSLRDLIHDLQRRLLSVSEALR